RCAPRPPTPWQPSTPTCPPAGGYPPPGATPTRDTSDRTPVSATGTVRYRGHPATTATAPEGETNNEPPRPHTHQQRHGPAHMSRRRRGAGPVDRRVRAGIRTGTRTAHHRSRPGTDRRRDRPP